MPLLLGQLVYTSFPEVGLKMLASAQVPPEIQQAFTQRVVYQYWDSYNPPGPGYRAAYLHQVTPEATLFGWLYNDGLDDAGRSHVPYFVCYYLVERLNPVLLEHILTCLHRGPAALIDRQYPPSALETIVASDWWSYQPVRVGVAIPHKIRDRAYTVLNQGRLLNLFIPVNDETVAPTAAQGAQKKAIAQSPTKIAGVTTSASSHIARNVAQAKPLSEPALAQDGASTLLFDRTVLAQESKTQVGKVALLIGVSDYGAGFDSIPEAQTDVQAVQQVLQHPDIGDFTDVKALLNPDRQAMEEAIETLVSEQQQDTLVLVYFRGHGLKDENGKLYLATSITRTNQQAKLVKSSAVPISFIQEVMSDSRSREQVMILDCHFSRPLSGSIAAETSIEGVSPAYPQEMEWLDPDESSGTIAAQLGQEGRTIIVSSTSAQYEVEQNKSGGSVYTHYLVEGLESGVADLDEDGVISVAELHQYASKKVQTVIPATQPTIYGAQAGHPIILAKAPVDDPKQRYRQEVERCASQGEISIVSRSVLDLLRDTLGLHPNETVAIEAGVLEPYLKYQKKLQRYAQGFVEAIRHESPIREATRNKLSEFQRTLGLTNADIAPIEAQVAQQIKALQASDNPDRSMNEVQAIRSEDLKPAKRLNKPKAASKTPIPMLLGSALQSVLPMQPLNTSSPRSTQSSSVLAQRNLWLMIGTGTVAVLALVGIAHTLNQWQNSRRLETVKALTQARNYPECVAVAKTISPNSSHYTDAQILLNRCETVVNWQEAQAQSLRGHSDAVWSISMSPDGKMLASAGGDKTIKLWDLQTGEQIRTLSGHSDTARTLAYALSAGFANSSNGQTLASGSVDKTIKIWNLQTGEPLRTLSGHTGRVISIATSPDGQTLASGSVDKTIKIWNLQTGELLHTLSGHPGWVNSVAISSDGQALASGSKDKAVKLWNLQTGELLHTFTGHPEDVSSVAISPDNKILVSGDKDGIIKIWRQRP